MATVSRDQIDEVLRHIRKMSAADRTRLQQLSVPRIVDPYVRHIPHPKQQFFLSLRQHEAMYGGAAGGGKSDALLMSALQYVDVPGYSALLLRRTWPDLSLPGAIMDRAANWLDGTPASPREGGRKWVFPSGARVSFGYLQRYKDVYRYQSAEFQFIGFDELTQFEDRAYQYMFSRIRRPTLPCLSCGMPVKKYGGGSGYKHTSSSSRCKNIFPDPKTVEQYAPAADGMSLWNVPLRMRSATNPGGIGHVWVRQRFIDPSTKERDAVFVPSTLRDNPSLDREEYERALGHLLPVDRERLLAGDWDVEEEGAYFQRHWFNPFDVVPLDRYQSVRFWDLAATQDGGDWTVGALVGVQDGRIFVEDIVRDQLRPHQVERLIQVTAARDGRNIPIRMEQEPGSAGVNNIDHYRREVLLGYDFDGVRTTGSKETRAKPLSSAAEAGNVYIKNAQWNRAFLDEAALFPSGAYDDQVDAVTGGFEWLVFGHRSRLIV